MKNTESISNLIKDWGPSFEFEEGVFAGVPNDIYHEQSASFGDKKALSSSNLKALKVSVSHALAGTFKVSKSMDLGTICHESVDSLYTGVPINESHSIVDSFGRSSKKDVAEFLIRNRPDDWENHLEFEKLIKKPLRMLVPEADQLRELLGNGKPIVSPQEIDTAIKFVKAINENPISAKLCYRGENAFSELSIIQEVEVNGVKILLKIRTDLIFETEEAFFIVDWKTIGKPATQENIEKQVKDFGYDVSSAMYHDMISGSDIFKGITGKPVHFYLVFVESENPCKEHVAVRRMSRTTMHQGRVKMMKALEKWAAYKTDPNQWIGVDQNEEEV